MRLTRWWMKLLIIFSIYWLCNIMLRLMLLRHAFTSCTIHDSTIPQVLNVSPTLFAIMVIFFSYWVLGACRNKIIGWSLLIDNSMVRICVWWGLRLNRSWHLLTELTAIWILRHFILVSLLVVLWTELGWLVVATWYLLLILAILAVYWPSRRSIFWTRPGFCGTLRVFHGVISSTIPFHKLLTISILVYWLKRTKCFWLMHPVRVWAVYILSLGWRIATDMSHVATLVMGIILLVKIWSLLHFNSAWDLIDTVFLRILSNLFLDVSWRLIVGIQLGQSRLLSKCPSLLVWKHDRLTCSIFRRTHTLGLWHWLSVMRLENATNHLLTLCRNTSSRWD